MTRDDPATPVVAETLRLRLRRFDPADAAFAFALVNDEAWIRYIGKRDVPDLDAAEQAVLAIGATKAEHQPGESFRVFLDPAGHPFCLVKP